MRTISASFLLLATLACGGGEQNPTTPQGTPTPTPTPQPTPTPNPYAASCGSPLPPHDKAYGYHVKVHSEPSRNRKVLNASPLIRDDAYCTSIGVPGGTCQTRFEDDPRRAACDHYLSGMSEAGRPGPDWYEEANGQRHRCATPTRPNGESPNCSVREENQYLLNIHAAGKYIACQGAGTSRTCGVCIVRDSDWGLMRSNPAGVCKLS